MAKARQRYWRNRRTIDKLAREGSYLMPEGMTHNQLLHNTQQGLYDALMQARDGSNVELFSILMDTWTLYSALVERGVQLTLL